MTFKTIAGNVTLSADVSANYSLTLPASSGLSGQFLTSVGGGNLTWYTPNFLTTASFNSYVSSIATPNLAQVLAAGNDANNQSITDVASLSIQDYIR